MHYIITLKNVRSFFAKLQLVKTNLAAEIEMRCKDYSWEFHQSKYSQMTALLYNAMQYQHQPTTHKHISLPFCRDIAQTSLCRLLLFEEFLSWYSYRCLYFLVHLNLLKEQLKMQLVQHIFPCLYNMLRQHRKKIQYINR